ncbi:hypothetical protein T484DRAFT_1825634 [Baffinella frigidus]|nr:hypothetical protein T484DRAFT_1825634 [Cryptophyta sp. CCMP2293]
MRPTAHAHSTSTSDIMKAFGSSVWCDEKPPHKFNDPSSTDHFAKEVALTTSHTKIDARQGKGASSKVASRGGAGWVDRSVLDSMTHLPRDKAAQMFGLCPTTFKKVCRRAGMQGWPYKRRHLLCAAQEWGGSCSCSTGCSRRNSIGRPSRIQETPSLVAARAASSPVRSTFSASHDTASQPIVMPLRSIKVGSVFSSSDSSMASSENTDGAVSFLDAADAQTIAAIGPTTSAEAVAQHSAEQSCNVVDAVMDYLDTLSSGCTSKGMAAVHHLELEAVVDGADVEG